VSEAQEIVGMDGLLDTPCQFCEAGVGEPCQPDCEALEANWPGIASEKTGDEWLMEEPDEFKLALMSSMYRLPFVGSFLQPPSYRGRSTDEWLAELGIWLDEYNRFSKAKIERLEGEARRAMALQLEKDVVRKFFMGTAPEQEKK
jgi:hypothetical protein